MVGRAGAGNGPRGRPPHAARSNTCGSLAAAATKTCRGPRTTSRGGPGGGWYTRGHTVRSHRTAPLSLND